MFAFPKLHIPWAYSLQVTMNELYNFLVGTEVEYNM